MCLSYMSLCVVLFFFFFFSINDNTVADNWATVDMNWEPLYTRAAVGEERSGVWGVNTGGVWAAAPWGAAAPPVASQTLQPESKTQVSE